jgi:hypothetical protein
VQKRILLIEQDTLMAMAEEVLRAEAGYEVACATGTLDRARSRVVGARADPAVLKAHLYGEPTIDIAFILRAKKIPFGFASTCSRSTGSHTTPRSRPRLGCGEEPSIRRHQVPRRHVGRLPGRDLRLFRRAHDREGRADVQAVRGAGETSPRILHQSRHPEALAKRASKDDRPRRLRTFQDCLRTAW